jgi:multidrug efflux system membrane fusion protein
MRLPTALIGGAALAAVAVGAYYYDLHRRDTARINAVQTTAQNRAATATRPAAPAASRPTGPGRRARPPVPVNTAVARRMDAPVTLTAIGAVQSISTVSIRAQIDGQIRQVHFTEGQRVKKGDLLFTIDPRPFQAALRAVEAALARNRALLLKAQSDLRRYRELSAREFASKQKYEEARANAAALEASIKGDEAQVDLARLRLGYTQIRSPIDGRAGSVLVTAGNLVKANDATLVVVNQTRPIYAAFSVPEKRLDEIRRYQADGPLTVRILAPEGSAPVPAGRLTFINNVVDQTTGTIQLKATFPNPDERLTPGQFVNVELLLTTIRQAVVVPSKAIQIGQREGVAFRYVFVVKADRTVQLRRVVPGVTFGDHTVLTSGIKAGERVVTVGQLRLRPGARVRLDTNARRMRPRGAK